MEMLVEVHGKLLGNSAVDQGRCTMSHAMTVLQRFRAKLLPLSQYLVLRVYRVYPLELLQNYDLEFGPHNGTSHWMLESERLEMSWTSLQTKRPLTSQTLTLPLLLEPAPCLHSRIGIQPPFFVNATTALQVSRSRSQWTATPNRSERYTEGQWKAGWKDVEGTTFQGASFGCFWGIWPSVPASQSLLHQSLWWHKNASWCHTRHMPFSNSSKNELSSSWPPPPLTLYATQNTVERVKMAPILKSHKNANCFLKKTT